MGKMKELYTAMHELQGDPDESLRLEHVIRAYDSLNQILNGVTPPEDFVE